MGVSALRGGRADGGEHVIASGGSQVRISEPQVTAGQAAKMGQNSSFGHVSQSVGEQIMESLHASTGRGDSQIVIRLNPPELGNVLVKFQQQSDQISGLLEVSSGQTKYEIEQA
jgi:flagellar hook-length control protein FliK